MSWDALDRVEAWLIRRALVMNGGRKSVTNALDEFIARREPVRVDELFAQLDQDPGFD